MTAMSHETQGSRPRCIHLAAVPRTAVNDDRNVVVTAMVLLMRGLLKK